MSTATEEQCGYQLKVGLEDEDFSTEPCGRPVWEDHDRCVWHAEVDGKTAEVLEEYLGTDGENFNGVYLKGAELVGVDWFAGASLIGADLTEARLNGADLSEASLMLATLTSVNAINTDFSRANLEGAVFTNADLRRATLGDALLNEAVFTNVHIGGHTELGNTSVYEHERVEPKLGDAHPFEAASWAYRQLQQIYRDNALPEMAQHSYTREKDARRKLAWAERDYPEAIKWELSRWVVLYGSSPFRVLVTAFLVVIVFAVLFPITGGIQETQGERVITYTLDDPTDAPQWWVAHVLFKSLYFSVVTFATLGYGDIQPIGTWARLLAGVETTLGTLLSALLVFVLARIVTW